MAAKNARGVGHDDAPERPPVAEAVQAGRLLDLAGKPRKYCRNRNVANAWNSPGMIRPRSVLTQPSVETSTKLGTNVTAAGISKVARIR